MSPFARRALFGFVLSLFASDVFAADYGRTPGSFGVSGGAAAYSIPIWTPPGPNGLTPSIALSYASSSGNGVGGVGWHLSAVSSIERCHRTKHQDGGDAAFDLTSNDRFCLGGNRLRLSSGTYGAANSVYFTEIADYSRVTAYGIAGNGPQYLIVEAKNGLKYEYGNTVDSRVFAGVSPTIATTPHRWMLNKVYDRSGNNYIVSYNNLNGFAVPDVISWTPTSLGAGTYRYEAKFNYSTRSDKDSFIGKLAGFDIANRYRLETIQVKSAGTVKRKYRLAYDTSSVTDRSRMTSAKECADDAETNCFLPIAFTYQTGVAGVAAGAATPPAGSSNLLKAGRYDLNGDGKDDLVYWSGSSWYVAMGANSGFAGPYNTGVTGSSALVDRFLPNGRDAIATVVGGNLWVYRWDDSTSAFVGHNTGVASAALNIAADYDGDGLADLVHYTPNNPILSLRRNNSTGSGNPSFESTTTTMNAGAGYSYGALFSYYGNGLQRADLNGDGRQDIYAVILIAQYNQWGQQIGNTPYASALLGSSSGFTWQPFNTWVQGGNPVWPSLNFNGDTCTDRLINGVVHIATCSGVIASTVNTPATPLVLLDWDGDGKTDILVNNGGTFGVYRSTGTGFSTLISTTIPSAGTFYALDQDGDKLEDLVKVNGTGAVSYWTHTTGGYVGTDFATNVPDLLSTVTDGFGVSHSISYASSARPNYYSHGAATNYPLQSPRPFDIVAQVTSSNGIGATYNKTYYYVGARLDALRGESAGFQRIDEVDGRNNVIRRDYFEQTFPVVGMLNQQEVMQPNGVTAMARTVFTNGFATLDSTFGNQRYFAYPQGSTSTRYEVGGTWNGALLSTTTTENFYDNTSGALYDQKIKIVEPASGANGVTAGGEWKARIYTPLANLVNDTTNWCMGRPGRSQQINSHNLAYGGSEITRTTDITWNSTSCRPTQIVDESGSGTLQVTTGIGYDSFGNVNSTTVTGTGMPARTTSSTYADGTFTTGQFPLSVTNALSQTSTVAWDYDFGVPVSATDPNGISVSWQYNAVGRRIRETRPDNTYTTWDFLQCTGCDSRARLYVDENVRVAGGTAFSRSLQFLDQFDRPIIEYGLRLDGNFNVTQRNFDSLGRVINEYFPYSSAASPVGYSTISYDLANRPTGISRPISDTNSTLQSTTISHEGLSTRVTDAKSKWSLKTVSANGSLRRSTDHDNYLQEFDYDAFGNPVRVVDQHGNVLQSSTYNLRGMLTQRTDMDMGAWSFTPNALGEVISRTDAKSQATTFTFDLLGRLTSRTESEGTSTWTWGVLGDNNTDSTGVHKYVGRIKSMSGSGYSESYVYDGLARPQTTTISADTTYQIGYEYNNIGALDSLTYPTSTSSYRLKVQYDYQYGHLYRIKDFNAPTTVFWTANAFNARNQITQETLGNGLVANRTIDAVTGSLKTIQIGVGGGTGVQNLAYEWDEVGNLKKRKDVNQSNLTEEFFYDNLHRLDYSQLNGVTNLDLSYDALGNITSKSDVGNYTYHTTKKHQVTSTSNGWSFGYDGNGNMTSGNGRNISWTSYNYPLCITSGADCTGTTSDYAQFSYTPDRQYWQQVSNYTNGGAATTIYVGGILEKVTTSAGTDYRHMIRAGGATAIVSRQTSGGNTTNYVTSDHLGSSSSITNGSGAILANSSFGAFGARRGSNWTGSPSSGDWTAIASTTRRGYTDHSMLDNLGLIHMNGRVQDPVLGRFVSADPYIADPAFTQSYNRYSYVTNSPLRFSDPSGFVPGPHTGPTPGYTYTPEDVGSLTDTRSPSYVDTVTVTGYVYRPPIDEDGASAPEGSRLGPCGRLGGGVIEPTACQQSNGLVGMGGAVADSMRYLHANDGPSQPMQEVVVCGNCSTSDAVGRALDPVDAASDVADLANESVKVMATARNYALISQYPIGAPYGQILNQPFFMALRADIWKNAKVLAAANSIAKRFSMGGIALGSAQVVVGGKTGNPEQQMDGLWNIAAGVATLRYGWPGAAWGAFEATGGREALVEGSRQLAEACAGIDYCLVQ